MLSIFIKLCKNNHNKNIFKMSSSMDSKIYILLLKNTYFNIKANEIKN